MEPATFIGGVVTSLVATAIVFAAQRVRIWRQTRRKIFLSMPMAGAANESDVATYRDLAARMVREWKLKGYECYSAYAEINSPSEFESAVVTTAGLLKKIRRSEFFILVYPMPLPTGSLVEIGYALGKRKKCIVLHRATNAIDTSNALPWLLAGIEKTPGTNFVIRKISYSKPEDILALIERSADDLLKFSNS